MLIYFSILASSTILDGQTFRSPANTAEWQIALAREGFSPGSIDAVYGAQAQAALIAYQSAHGLTRSGYFDAATTRNLKIQEPIFANPVVSQVDIDRIRSKPKNWRARGETDYMGYNSILEWAAEQSQSDPDYIKQLNHGLDRDRLQSGSRIRVPDIETFRTSSPVCYIRIRLCECVLKIFSPADRVLFHSPVSIARRVENRPYGELRVGPSPPIPNILSIRKSSLALLSEKASKGDSSSQPDPTIPSARDGSVSIAPASESTERPSPSKSAAPNPTTTFGWPIGTLKPYSRQLA
ncbi:MAG: peptidoglycan-binding domain-containing protein [Verrucomicrobiota bacterium]|nr:peptidoglycan-binding domain-containing protein [Verrucomicrobiota bacterium]